MPVDTNVMTDLRRRWKRAPVPPDYSKLADTSMIGCPLDHRDPTGWKYTPDPKRSGYRRVECGFCGRFYGYAPPEGPKRRHCR